MQLQSGGAGCGGGEGRAACDRGKAESASSCSPRQLQVEEAHAGRSTKVERLGVWEGEGRTKAEGKARPGA